MVPRNMKVRPVKEKRRKPQVATAPALKNIYEIDQSCGFCNNEHYSKTNVTKVMIYWLDTKWIKKQVYVSGA